MSLGVQADQHPMTTRLVRGLLWVFLAGAAVVAAIVLVVGTIAVIRTLVSGQVPLNLVAEHPLSPGTDAGTAKIVSGSYESASLVISHLSSGAVALATISSIANTLTQAAVALLVAILAWRLLHRRLFRRSLSFATTFGGGILLVGGMIAQGAGSLVTGIAAAELNGTARHGPWPLAGRFDLTFPGRWRDPDAGRPCLRIWRTPAARHRRTRLMAKRSLALRIRSASGVAIRSLGPNTRAAVKEVRGRVAVSYAYFVARIYAAGAILFTGAQLVSDFTSNAVNVSLPVQQFWPVLPAGARITGGPTAHVVNGGFTDASVTVSGLDIAARSWLAATTLLQGATVAILAIMVATLCSTVLKNRPFRPALTLGIRTTAFAIMFGGIGWQVCSAIGRTLAAHQVLQLGSTAFPPRINYPGVETIMGFPSPGWDGSIDLWPIWVGLAFFALAAAFRYGERLQRDTEGLV
jgi:hypothetical protein